MFNIYETSEQTQYVLENIKHEKMKRVVINLAFKYIFIVYCPLTVKLPGVNSFPMTTLYQ